MQWSVIVILLSVVVVIGVAYALGTYMRRRQDDMPDLARPFVTTAKTTPISAIHDREVRVVVNWLLSVAFEQTGVKVADDKLAFERIVNAADKAVRELKNQPVVTVSLPYLTADASGPKHLEARLTREMIVELANY
jgi:hypothetical protein